MNPKETDPFLKPAEFGKEEYGSSYFGMNELNAVVEHQLHQVGYATSGISTTPHIDRAKFYATHGGKWDSEMIYKIRSTDCEKHKVQIYIVSEIVPQPEIPEDEEVILVAKGSGELPIGIVSKVHEFVT